MSTGRSDGLSDALLAKNFPDAVRVKVHYARSLRAGFWQGLVLGISGAVFACWLAEWVRL